MLANIASQLHASWHKRHLLFLVATIITVLFVGYQFGTFDEAMHIPFLKVMADPTLYPGDAMLSLQSIYYSYFWHFFIPFLKLGLLEPVLFIVHFASIYLSYWAIWELSVTLFHNPLASFFSVIAFIMPHFSFVGFPVFEFGPLSRTFVLPFLLFAMNLFFKDRIILAFFVAGLMFNIHVVSVNFVLAMFGLACLLEFPRIGIRKIMPGLAVFIIAALPVLMWKAGGDAVDISLRPAWVDFLNRTLFLHIFAMVGPFPGPWLLVLGGLSAIIVFFISVPWAGAPQQAGTARIFIYAGVLVLLANVISVNWLPVTIIIQSQIARIGLWILIIAYFYFANLLARLYVREKVPSAAYWLLFITFMFSPTPILPVLAWLLVRLVKNTTIIKAATIFVPIGFLAACGIFIGLGLWRPGIFIFGQMSPWVDVQNWARENTPVTSRFITPPERWGLQESDWRVHSERASAATLSELLVAAFQPGYEVEWQPRFESVAPGALASFNGDYFWNVEVTRKAYQGLSTPQLLKAACRYNVQYIVSEKPFLHKLSIAYENSSFVVYDVQKIACQ